MSKLNFIQRAAIQIAGLKTMVTLVETWKEGRPIYADVNFESLVRQAWRKNELIFACISAKASTASQVRLKPYNTSKEEMIRDRNHPLARLLKKPNPFMSEYDFWSSIIIYQELAGRAIFEKQRDNAGNVIALWPLRPDWVNPIPSSTQMIAAYQYTVPGLPPVFLDRGDVLDFKLFDPLNLFHTWPPVAVAARIVEIDNTSTDYIKTFFQEGGAPPGIIKTTQRLRDAEAEEIRRKWADRYGGARNWSAPAVLDRDAEYQKTGSTFEEMGFSTLDSRNEARICATMRVPPIIVGAKVGLDRSTFANYKEARLAWWEDTLVPIYQNFNDVIDNQLIPEFGDSNLEGHWDFSEVPALREERLIVWEKANNGLRMGGITVNEYRKEIGLAAVRSGDVFLRMLNLMEVPLEHTPGEGGAQQAVKPEPVEKPVEEEGDKDPDEANENSTQEDENQVVEKTLRSGEKSGNPIDKETREKLERMLQRDLESFFKYQLKGAMDQIQRHPDVQAALKERENGKEKA